MAGSIAVQVLLTETSASIADGASVVDAGGNVEVSAKGDLKSMMIMRAIGGGSSAYFGVANTTMVHTDSVRARIGSGNDVTSALHRRHHGRSTVDRRPAGHYRHGCCRR
ncbi:hypothetical protein LP419_39610 [Massilia sp. H-1]|nr:hypothetical protein LP419_39610 [Massilia sp. H-1]